MWRIRSYKIFFLVRPASRPVLRLSNKLEGGSSYIIDRGACERACECLDKPPHPPSAGASQAYRQQIYGQGGGQAGELREVLEEGPKAPAGQPKLPHMVQIPAF